MRQWTNTAPKPLPGLGGTLPADLPGDSTGDNHLDAFDEVTVTDAKGVEIFKITVGGFTGHARVERTAKDPSDPSGASTTFYQLVDIVADVSQTDGGDNDPTPEHLRPTPSIPVATEYSHIHFGVWAGLGAAKGDGTQDIAELGIGFVQNIGEEGMTDRQGIGTATFNGDWVAAVRRQYASDAEAGAIKMDDGSAKLTADFGKDTVEAVLTGLATLEGTLSGNGFSGMTAKAISHNDLDKAGKFAGSFSGGIYGSSGSEAAGVFDFNGGEAGAFRGAFGGAQ